MHQLLHLPENLDIIFMSPLFLVVTCTPSGHSAEEFLGALDDEEFFVIEGSLLTCVDRDVRQVPRPYHHHHHPPPGASHLGRGGGA